MLFDGFKTVHVELSDIICIVASGHKCIISTKGEQDLELTCSLNCIEENLPKDRLVRIHRQCLINPMEMRETYGNVVIMKDGRMLTVGKTYKHALQDKINLYIFGSIRNLPFVL